MCVMWLGSEAEGENQMLDEQDTPAFECAESGKRTKY